MAWLKLEDTFHDSPKIRRLARALKVPVPQAAGHLAMLWSWALRHAPDGDLSKFDRTDIESAAGHRESKKKVDFFGILCDCGFIDGNRIHNWVERGGSFVENHKRNQRRRRAESEMSADSPRTDPGQSAACPPLEEKEEKRREEKEKKRKEKKTNVAASAAPVPSSSTQDIRDVIDYYRRHFPRRLNGYDSTFKEWKLVKDRLKQFSVGDLKNAIDGCAGSEWHQENNHTGLALVMRSTEKVEQFVSLHEEQQNPTPKKTGTYLDLAADYFKTSPQQEVGGYFNVS